MSTPSDQHEPDLDVLFHEARRYEPTDADVNAALAAAAKSPRRTSRGVRRIVLVVLAVLVGGGSVAVALPPVRDAIASAWDNFTGLFDDGELPGAQVSAFERPGELNWLLGSDPATARAIAIEQDQRLAGYRNASTGLACLSYGLFAEECLTEADWRARVANRSVFTVGPLFDSGRAVVFTVASDEVRRVELRLADGEVITRADVRNGAVFVLPAGTVVAGLTTYSDDGAVVGQESLADRVWDAP